MSLPILLGSSSGYRRSLLEKLQLPFIWTAPSIDETPLTNEPPATLALRLAKSKAQSLASSFPNYLIIGSDQTCTCKGKIYGKPYTPEQAFLQLRAFSGERVIFYTGLCLYNSQTHTSQEICETYTLEFRNLDNEDIREYIRREEPLDCAGSIKTEGLGITLIKAFIGEDPNSLVGLPLIKLIDMLKNEGYNPLTPRQPSSSGK